MYMYSVDVVKDTLYVPFVKDSTLLLPRDVLPL